MNKNGAENIPEKHKKPEELASEASISDLFNSVYSLIMQAHKIKSGENIYKFSDEQGREISISLSHIPGEEIASLSIVEENPMNPDISTTDDYSIIDDESGHLRISKLSRVTYEAKNQITSVELNDNKDMIYLVSEKETQTLIELVQSHKVKSAA